MIPLIIIRPQPGCDATLSAARDLGLAAHGFPLFEVQPLVWDAPDPDSCDALLTGSANALRHGGAALTAFRGKPVYAVGETTAEAARTAGLDVISCGEGGLQGLLDTLRPGHQRLLRLAGREHVPLTPQTGVSITVRIVYASEAQSMPPTLVRLLARPALVLLHSAVAARHFANQCDTFGIARANHTIATLGSRIAQAAGTGWNKIRVAAVPNDQALLALAKQVCHDHVGTNE